VKIERPQAPTSTFASIVLASEDRFEMSDFAEPAVGADKVDDELAAMFDLKQKKKKKKKSSSKSSDGAAGAAAETGTLQEGDRPPYTYGELLKRVTTHMTLNNPDFFQRAKITIKPPQLMRVGTKKTLWTNFQDICNTMRRNADHVFQFMMAELGTEGSIDGNRRLVIRGKFVPKYIESLLRKYIIEYVSCTLCKSFDKTDLTRDSTSRLYFLHCDNCGSSRSVAPIRSGYHAQTRADRRALRK
jgi:translation initiation factor 2 subunit 2